MRSEAATSMVLGIIAALLAACPPDAGEPGEGEGEGEGEPGIDRNVCESDADCLVGTVCSNIGLGDVRDYCTTTCIDDADCDVGDGFTYTCAPNDRCIRTCDGPNDCGDQGFCATGDEINPDGICFGFPADPCNGDKDCANEDEVCVYVNGEVEWASFCGPRETQGGLRTGEPCDPSADPDTLPVAERCGINFCLPHGLCSGPCAADVDCPDDEWSCQGFDIPTQQGSDVIGFCDIGANDGPPCLRDADCADGETCALANSIAGETLRICRVPRSGELPGGAACGDDAATPETEPVLPCRSALCLDGACASLCVEDADCGGFICDAELGACTTP